MRRLTTKTSELSAGVALKLRLSHWRRQTSRTGSLTWPCDPCQQGQAQSGSADEHTVRGSNCWRMNLTGPLLISSHGWLTESLYKAILTHAACTSGTSATNKARDWLTVSLPSWTKYPWTRRGSWLTEHLKATRHCIHSKAVVILASDALMTKAARANLDTTAPPSIKNIWNHHLVIDTSLLVPFLWRYFRDVYLKWYTVCVCDIQR